MIPRLYWLFLGLFFAVLYLCKIWNLKNRDCQFDINIINICFWDWIYLHEQQVNSKKMSTIKKKQSVRSLAKNTFQIFHKFLKSVFLNATMKNFVWINTLILTLPILMSVVSEWNDKVVNNFFFEWTNQICYHYYLQFICQSNNKILNDEWFYYQNQDDIYLSKSCKSNQIDYLVYVENHKSYLKFSINISH